MVSAWLEAFEQLSEAQKSRLRRWIQLQELIADTLRIPFETWIETYIGEAMQRPFDYSFMQVTVPGFVGLELEGAAVSFSATLDPATARTARVPVRAQNQLGRLSSDFQDRVVELLDEKGVGDSHPVPPGDVACLQKVFPREKALAQLKRKDFRKVRMTRQPDSIVLEVEGDPLLKQDIYEFSAVMNKPHL